MEAQESRCFTKARFGVLGAVLSFIAMGQFLAYETQLPQMAKNFSKEASSQDVDIMTLPTHLIPIFYFLLAWTGSLLADSKKYKILLTIILILISYSCLLYQIVKDRAIFILSYSFFNGLGLSLGYIPVLYRGSTNYPKIPGKIYGLIIGAFSFGGFIFASIAYNLDDSLQAYKINSIYKFIFVACLLLGSFGLLYLKKSERQEEPEINENIIRYENNLDQSFLDQQKNSCQTLSVGLKYFKFWRLFLMNVLSVSFSFYIISTFKSNAEQKSISSDFLSFVRILGLLFCAISQVTFGSLFDKKGFNFSYKIILSLQLFSAASFFILDSFLSNTDSSKYFYAFLVLLCFVCLGAHTTLAPSIIIKIFGNKLWHKVFGMFLISFGLASCINYCFNQILFFVSSLLSFVLALDFKETTDWREYYATKGLNYEEDKGHEQ